MMDMIQRVVTSIMYDEPVEVIYAKLIEAGMSDYDAWLTYKAAQVHIKMSSKEIK